MRFEKKRDPRGDQGRTRIAVLACLCAAVLVSSCSMWSNRSDEDLGAHMDEHFGAAVDVQTAVIRGDLAEAVEQAAWLANHPVPSDLPNRVLTHVGELRAAARDASSATSIAQAAAATARVGVACGACHASSAAGPGFLPGSPPELGPDVATRMTGHIWATDRMWEGLISPSEESWQTGAAILSASLLSPRLVTDDSTEVARMNAIVEEVAGIATFAQRTAEWERRGALYGQLLPNCSACHEIVGVDPLGLPN